MAFDTSFELVPAKQSDAPRMAHVHAIASASNVTSKLYFVKGIADFEARVREALEGQIGYSGWQHMKIVDKESGILAAWVSWHTPPDAQIRERDAEAALKPEDRPVKEVKKGQFAFPPGLPSHVRDNYRPWLQRWTAGRRHISLHGLFTDPAYQRRGMGKALVLYCNQQADVAGLPTFLQATQCGYPLYAQTGFEAVQHLEIDLRDWAPDAKSNDKGLGNYRYRYMVRLPQTVPQGS
ncbi:hypothetical protein MMC25_003923 [Agyrium rufum]|nr:hypothetical protein [Agyrium rufum]